MGQHSQQYGTRHNDANKYIIFEKYDNDYKDNNHRASHHIYYYVNAYCDFDCVGHRKLCRSSRVESYRSLTLRVHCTRL